MINPDLFLESAKRLVTENEANALENYRLEKEYTALRSCCCDAIDEASLYLNTGYNEFFDNLNFFKNLFEPADNNLYWWQNPEKTDEDQEARRLALLFAYEIAKEEAKND